MRKPNRYDDALFLVTILEKIQNSEILPLARKIANISYSATILKQIKFILI